MKLRTIVYYSIHYYIITVLYYYSDYSLIAKISNGILNIPPLCCQFFWVYPHLQKNVIFDGLTGEM